MPSRLARRSRKPMPSRNRVKSCTPTRRETLERPRAPAIGRARRAPTPRRARCAVPSPPRPPRLLRETSRVNQQTHDIVIIGAGPGGYVAALRAAQLGLNVGCIDKEKTLGGTCVRIGCIPSKALLESSELFRQTKQDFKAHGIAVKSVELDLTTMLARKDRVVDGLTRGVAGLFKKNNVTRYEGSAHFAGPGRVVVESSGGTVELSAK